MIHNEPSGTDFDDSLQYFIRVGDNEQALLILRQLNPRDLTDSSRGRTLLHVAAEYGNEIIALYLLEEGCEVDARDNDGNTPLILASLHAGREYQGVIGVLIRSNASVLTVNSRGRSAAEIVIGDPNVKIFILDNFLNRVREECSNDSLRTARELLKARCRLTRAVRLRDTAITKYMLDNGCDVSEPDTALKRMTPLHQALLFNDLANAELLIESGADVNAGDQNGTGPVSYASDRGILETLLDRGERVIDDSGTLLAGKLFQFLEREVVEMLMKRYNLDFSTMDADGSSLFHHVVQNKCFDPVDLWRDNVGEWLDVDQPDGKGFTALMSAAKAGNPDTVDLLLKMGAEVNHARDGHTALLYAVCMYAYKEEQKARDRIIMLLLRYGADVQWTNYDGLDDYTLIDYTLTYKQFAMVKTILARLALIEELGGEIKVLIRANIAAHAMCARYFDFCKRTIEKLKRIAIKRRATLFEFLTVGEDTLLKLARSEDFVSWVQSIAYHKRRSNSYYYQTLRQRVKKAVDVATLRRSTFDMVSEMIPELKCNQIVIEKIVEYIIYDDLRVMASRPTFKCIIENVIE